MMTAMKKTIRTSVSTPTAMPVARVPELSWLRPESVEVELPTVATDADAAAALPELVAFAFRSEFLMMLLTIVFIGRRRRRRPGKL